MEKKMKKTKKTITLTQYKKDALSTAFYPSIGDNILYPLVALFEESGELVEKLLEGADHKEIAKEAGDVLWYSAMIFHELKEDFQFTIEDKYLTTDKLLLHNCRIAGIIKKSQRDEGGELVGDKRELLKTHLNFVLTFVLNVCLQIGYTLESVCEMNIDKIADRIKRGQLSGSGDNR